MNRTREEAQDLLRDILGDSRHLLFVIRKRGNGRDYVDVYTPPRQGDQFCMRITNLVARSCGYKMSRPGQALHSSSLIHEGGGMDCAFTIGHALSRRLFDSTTNVFRGEWLS